MIDKRRALGRKPAMVLTLLALILLLFAGVSYNASKPGQEIEGCPRGCASISPNQDNVLRVMSLNMLHGFPQFEAIQSRLDLIASEILRVEADIVCLQETPWSRQTASAAGYLSKMTALNYVYLRANGNRKVIFFEEGSAILSRYPLIGLTHKELEPQAGFFEHRIVLHAIAVSPWGDIDVYVTHLTNGERQTNAGQVGALKEYVEDTRQGVSIVAGDFNALPDSPQILELSQYWIDAYRQVNSEKTGATCCIDDLNITAQELQKRIDYIFLVPGEQTQPVIEQAGLVLGRPLMLVDGWQWASDHVGLLVSLSFE
jgi:endonuclease/exonuclease/phosphatase family metal-dependent hydrolase